MSTFSSHATGSPCWVDLMSPDADASIDFYSAVFGWDVERQTDDEGNQIYALFQQTGKNVAGVGGQMPEMAGMPPVWNSYVAVDDVAKTVEKATGAGGSVIAPPMQVMEAGEMAVIADPTGAVISVWRADQHIGAEVCNEPDTYSWNELMTRDIGSAMPFYSTVFGWDIQGQDMGPMGTYYVAQGGENGGLAGMMAMPPGVPDMVPNHWAVYFTVADTDATVEKVTANGGSVTQEAMDIPGVGRIAGVHDPVGGSFSLMQPE